MAARDLLDYVWGVAPRKPKDDLHILLMNLLGRSIGTYRGLLRLLEGGFVEQAFMLNRSMFEDLIFGYWVSLPANRAGASSLVEQHINDALDRSDYLLAQLDSGGLDALTRPADAAKDWKGRAGLVRNLDKMVEDIEPLWAKEGGSVGELHGHRAVANWMTNLALHTSGFAVEGAMMRGSVKVPGGGWLYGYGQGSTVDEKDMLANFNLAAFRLGWLARRLLLESDQSVDGLESVYAKVKHAIAELGPSKLRKLERNDPCWCGSGTKFKRCHGA